MQHRTLLLCVLVGLTFVGMNISLSQVQSWQQIGLAGTDLEAVEVNSDGYIYAAVHPGGLYRTTDNGGTWVLGTMTPTTPFFHDIKEYTSGDLFAGAGDYGVYRSTDKGVMWQRTALDTGIIWEIHIDSRQYIYAGGTGKFHRSTDGGVNWSETTGWTHAVYGFAFKPGYMFIGIHAEGVFRSTNDGATWTTVNNSLGNIYVEALTVATNGDLYVGTGGGIYKSTNNGDSWSHLNTGTIGRVHSILITLNGYMYAGSDSGVVLSSDMGGTWEKRNTGLTALDATDLALGLDGNLYLATWGGGVHKSIQTADPVQFWQQTGGPPGGQVNCLGSTLSGDLFAGTANLGVHRSANQGASWSQVSPMQFYSILMKPNGYIFGGTTGQGVQRSTDGGTSWGSVNTGFAEDTAFSLAMAPNGDVFAGGGEGKVFRSTNDGGNWSQLAYSMAGEEVFAFTFKNPGYIFVGTYGAGVFRSTDDGASWSQMNAGLTDLYVQSLARNAYGHVFAGTNGGVFRTTDNGANWTKLNYSWSSLVHVVSINSQGELYATSESGVYMSTDYGTSWTQVNGGLTNLSVGAITFDQEGYGYVGTWGSEVFRTLGSRGTLHNYEYRADENTVLLFHLNESSGSLSHDHSSYGNHGIVSGSSIVAGRYGNGRGLNGSGNYISVSDAPSLRPTLVTVEAWVYSDNYTGMPWGIIVTKERTSSSFSYRLSMAGSTGQIYFGTGISQNDGITSSAVLGNGKWYHVAGTFDGSMLRVYVNGVLSGSKSQPGTIPYNADVLYLGRDIDNIGVWKGIIDEVRTSNKARSPQEFNAVLPPKNLTASATGSTIQLSWQPDGLITPVQYKVYRGADSSSLALIATTGGTSHSDPGLAVTTTYFYRITALDQTGFESEWSFAAHATTSGPQGITMSVSDGCGGSGALEFTLLAGATDGLDAGLGEAELPPPPPVGTFDARFVLPTTPAVTSLKDFRSDTSTTATWKVMFQPGSCGYPVTFNWGDVSSLGGSLYLRDEVTGSIVNIDMKSQSSYGLSNTGITSLLIVYMETLCKTVNVASGWNMVSVPVTAIDMNVTSLFPGAVSSAYGYSGGYVTVSTMYAGNGYWLKFAQSAGFQICGQPVIPSDVAVGSGWQMIGPFESDVTVSSITSTPSGIVTSNYYGYQNGYTTATTLGSGKGYWVKTSQPGMLHLGGAMQKPIPPEKDTRPSWVRVSIEGIDRQVCAVYLADAGSIPLLSGLPPLPPRGIMDVRYSSNTNVEQFGRGEHTLRLSSARYPIKITAENLAGRSLRLRDAIDGKIIDRTLRDREPVLISEAMNQLVLDDLGASSELPEEFALEQNYPNPFNPLTRIKFALPVDSRVRLVLYDVLGQEVAALVEGEREAGYHVVEFDGTGFASGVYIYRIEAGDFVQTMKMLLVK